MAGGRSAGPRARHRRRDGQWPGGRRPRKPFRESHRHRALRGATRRGACASARRVPLRGGRVDFRRLRQRGPPGRRPGGSLVWLAAVRSGSPARAAAGRRARVLDLRQLPRDPRDRPPRRRFFAGCRRSVLATRAPTRRRGLPRPRRADARARGARVRDANLLGHGFHAGLPRHLVRRATLQGAIGTRSAWPARRAALGRLGRGRAGHALAARRSGSSQLSHDWSRAGTCPAQPCLILRALADWRSRMSLRTLTPAVLCLAVASAAFADDAANAARVTGIDTTAMDKAVRPQDDLFRHVNGSWLANTPFPAEYASAGIGIVLFEKAQADVQAILLDAAAAGDKATPEMQRLGAMYSSFMDEAKVESRGIEPLEPLFAEIAAIDGPVSLATWFGRAQGRAISTPLGV